MPKPNVSDLIDEQIAGLPDWRGTLLAKLRALVLKADPDIVEEWKWGTAVWSRDGMVCSAGVFKEHVKLNFFQGASLPDPKRIFNAGLDAKTTRAIDFHHGDKLDAAGIRALVRAAVEHNAKKRKPPRK